TEIANAEAKRQEGIARENADKERIAGESAEDQTKIAKERLLAAQLALTDSFFRTIGVSYDNFPPRDEREALWELAQLDRSNGAVRANLLNRWFATEDAFNRAENHNGRVFTQPRDLTWNIIVFLRARRRS